MTVELAVTELIETDPRRWFMLLLYCVQTLLNQAIWLTFAPIAFETGAYYHATNNWVNSLSMVFMVLYPFGMLLSARQLQVSLRSAIVWGALMNLVACVFRAGSVFCPMRGGAGFGVLLAGQSIAGLAQPLLTNAPARIASDWFPKEERERATTIAAVSLLLGNGVGQAIPPILIAKDDSGRITGMGSLLAGELVLVFFSAFSILAWFVNAPECPPSHAAAVRRRSSSWSNAGQTTPMVSPMGPQLAAPFFLDCQQSVVHMDDTAGIPTANGNAATQRPGETPLDRQTTPASVDSAGANCNAAGASAAIELLPPEKLTRVYGELLCDAAFLPLMLCMGLGLGAFNSLMTVMERVVHPVGYNKDVAGMFGAVMLLAGIPSAGFASVMLDRTGAYRIVFKVGAGLGLVAATLFFLLLRPGQLAWSTVSVGILGACAIPLFPVAIGTAAEITFPAPEEASSGLIMLTGQFLGIGAIFLFSACLPEESVPPKFTTVWTPMCIASLSTFGLIALMSQLVNAKYKRRTVEAEEARRVASLESCS